MGDLDSLEEIIKTDFAKKNKWFYSNTRPVETEYEKRLRNQVHGKLQQMDWTLKQIRKIRKLGVKQKTEKDSKLINGVLVRF